MNYVAYYRVSTRGQEETGHSLDGQRATVKHFYNSGRLIEEFVEVESGGASVEKRVELEKAIKLCKKNNNTLVVSSVDRFARWAPEKTIGLWRELDGKLEFCDLPPAEDESMFRLLLYIKAWIAERERKLVGIRTKTGLAAAKAKGIKLGSPENLTDESRERSALVRTEAAKAAYRPDFGYIKLMRDNGLSYRHIAKQLNEEGKRTRQGKPFQATTVHRILKRGNGDR